MDVHDSDVRRRGNSVRVTYFLWFKQARTGDLDAKSDIWTNLMSAIAHGWVLAKATTQPVNIERQFSAAAKMLDAAYDHLYKTGEVLR